MQNQRTNTIYKAVSAFQLQFSLPKQAGLSIRITSPGPCILLNPRLIKLVTEYGGKCLLVLANTVGNTRSLRVIGSCWSAP